MWPKILDQFLVHPSSAMRKVRGDHLSVWLDGATLSKFLHHLHDTGGTKVALVVVEPAIGAIEQGDVQRGSITELIERRGWIQARVVTVEDRLPATPNPKHAGALYMIGVHRPNF